MLETRMPPMSTRTTRAHTAARPMAASLREQAARPAVSADPIRRTLPSARQSRLSRSEMRLMGLATASTAIVCALLLLYLAAYAHVTQLGIAQARARAQLRQNQTQNALLLAQCNSLESPEHIVAAAKAQRMIPRGATTVNYIAARPVPGAEANSGAQYGIEVASETDQRFYGREFREQGSKGGTTEDSRAAAPFSH